MVGGRIIGIAFTGPGEALVNLRGTGCERNDTIAVRCRHADKPIAIGDSLWWHGDKCYWTPKSVGSTRGLRCGIDFDIPLLKVGYSHAHAHV